MRRRFKLPKSFWFLSKLALSVAILVVIVRKVFEGDNATQLIERLDGLHWGWLAVAALIQCAAIVCSVFRWNWLLKGQGIFAPLRHLFGSFMIGRFFGAFTPGGWTGLGGYRIYDISRHTGKTARAATTIGIEILIGQLGFGAVAIAGSFYGLRYLGLEGVLLVDLFFLGLIGAIVVALAKPGFIALLAKRFPRAMQPKLQSMVDAACAYRGKGGIVLASCVAAMGTHAFNNLIYVATAKALGVHLGVGEVFFVSAMQIFSTVLPASINGMGLREATAVMLYSRVGVPVVEAALIPMVGFAVEMAVSAIGGAVLIARSSDYTVKIHVEDEGREDAILQAAPKVEATDLPKRTRAFWIGALGGLFGGGLLGGIEATRLAVVSRAAFDARTIAYGIGFYGALFAVVCAVTLFGLAWLGRWMQREALPEAHALGVTVATSFCLVGFAIAAFMIRRDVFHEELVWKSPKGLLILLASAVSALFAYALIKRLFAWMARGRIGRRLLSPLGVLASGLIVIGGALGAHALPQDAQKPAITHAKASQNHGPILFIVVDTLRADRLPNYGYAKGNTPNLDAFAKDAVRFEQAFSNASWTRPSFASLLTGRFASSHRTMAKSDALPDALVTLPEALGAEGYNTAGFVTNYNVAPFYNFHQGFDDYHYLEPAFVLGARDADAKLLLVQFGRQRIETYRAKRGIVTPGSAYQDAETVNHAVMGWLQGKRSDAPWFLFVGYMDPHDPYFEHPYAKSGYSRAAHQSPELKEAPILSKLYDGEITYWDGQFGTLVAQLKQQGLYDGLTIVVTADHGEEFGEHGGFWHGTTLYDEQIHVPLLVKLPGNARGGTTVNHWVQSIDIMPTLLTMAQIKVPEGVQGGDLFRGSEEVFAEESHEGNVLEALRTRHDQHAKKLITAKPGGPRGLPSSALFDVDADPAERTNLAESTSPAVAELQAKLRDARMRAEKGAASRKVIDVAVEPGAEERLKALGYVGE